MSKLRIDLTGQKFCKLTVLKCAGHNKRGNADWLCLCDCGQQKIVDGSDLKAGNTKSCGCLRIKHGHVINNNASQLYSVWRHMKQRCTNPNNDDYHNYGGRGITVCKRWLKFPNFLEDMGKEWKPGLTLERRNNDKGYSLKNCYWATRKEQARNRRNNHLILSGGKTQCIAKWAKETGINQKTLWHRIVTLGWSPKKALTTPVKKI